MTEERSPASGPERDDAGPGNYLTRLLIRDRARTIIVPIRQVEWIEASDDNVAVHVFGRRHLIHVTLSTLERRLDPATFLRVHRCSIVNLDFVESFLREADGRLTVRMRDGARIGASRTRARALRGIGF